MKLATKLSLSLGIFAVQMVGLGVFCLMQMASINGFSTAISGEWIPRIILAEELRVDADRCVGSRCGISLPECRKIWRK